MCDSTRVLIVDDQPANVRLMQSILAAEGLTETRAVLDPRGAVAAYDEFRPGLVLLDLRMHPLDGLAVLDLLRPRFPADEFVPVIILTADTSPEARLNALARGASDFLSKPVDPLEVGLRLRNLLRTRELTRQLADQNRALDETVRERTRQVHDQLRLLNLASDALSAVDMDGRVLFWNKGAERLFGWKQAEAMGQSVRDLLRPDSASEAAQAALLRDGEWSGELAKKRKDGTEVMVRSRWTLVADEQG